MNMNVKLIVPTVLAAVALTACSSGSKPNLKPKLRLLRNNKLKPKLNKLKLQYLIL